MLPSSARVVNPPSAIAFGTAQSRTDRARTVSVFPPDGSRWFPYKESGDARLRCAQGTPSFGTLATIRP
jgi:hypothetical protein